MSCDWLIASAKLAYVKASVLALFVIGFFRRKP